MADGELIDASAGSPPLAREQQQKNPLKYAFPLQPILILIHLYLFRRILFLTLIPYVDITDTLVLHLQELYVELSVVYHIL